MWDYAIHQWPTILMVVGIFTAPGLFGLFVAGPSDGSGVWMQDRPQLCWALVWFGLAALCRVGWLLDPVPSERIEAWTAAGMCLSLSGWFLLQHWLDKREGSARPARRPAERGWGHDSRRR